MDYKTIQRLTPTNFQSHFFLFFLFYTIAGLHIYNKLYHAARPEEFWRTDSLVKEQMKNDCVVNQYIKVFVYIYMYIKENDLYIIYVGLYTRPTESDRWMLCDGGGEEEGLL